GGGSVGGRSDGALLPSHTPFTRVCRPFLIALPFVRQQSRKRQQRLMIPVAHASGSDPVTPPWSSRFRGFSAPGFAASCLPMSRQDGKGIPLPRIPPGITPGTPASPAPTPPHPA